MYLLDTNVVSQVAPTKAVASEELRSWMQENADLLFLSVVTASEIEAGIAKAQRSGAIKKAATLRSWWSSLEATYAKRLLPFDLRAAHAAGRIVDHARAYRPQYQDVAIAATALVRDFTVVTSNERHFEPLGVLYVNPRVLTAGS